MKKVIISMSELAGTFAENKEVAKKLRIDIILPSLLLNKDVIFDFSGVTGATQSFIHALISEPIRKFRDTAYENLYYDNANDNIREIISIVYRYMQESLSEPES